MATIRVQSGPFDLAAETQALGVGRADIGGIGCFIGQVRAEPGLVALTLEHYPGMSDQALARIAVDAETRFGLIGCTVIHRYGRLAIGEPIVLVLAAASHRQAALDATGFLIDWLKTDAPFWKRCDYEDGSHAWVEPRETDAAARQGWLRR